MTVFRPRLPQADLHLRGVIRLADYAKSIRLPDGSRIDLEKPWQDFTVSELAALGLRPNMFRPGQAADSNVSGFIPLPDAEPL